MHQRRPAILHRTQLQTFLLAWLLKSHLHITPSPRKLCIASVRLEETKNPLTLFWRSASCLSELEEVSLRSFHLHLCPAALPLQYYFSLWAEHTIAV